LNIVVFEDEEEILFREIQNPQGDIDKITSIMNSVKGINDIILSKFIN
jgi:hypothetical protein